MESRNKISQQTKPIAVLVTTLTLLAFLCGAGPSGSNDGFFGELPGIHQKFNQILKDLDTKYYSESISPEDKKKVSAQEDATKKEFGAAIDQFSQAHSLVGKEIPFEAMGSLPFVVQNVKMTIVKRLHIKFHIQVKIKEDIKNDKGELDKSTKVHFMAFDSDGKAIPGTNNWAVNRKSTILSAGTVIDALGWWNSDDLQNMDRFGSIRIMPEDDYKRLKKLK